MAKKRKYSGFGKIGRKKAKAKKGKGHVPLKILEKRLGKLTRIVKSRGGHAK